MQRQILTFTLGDELGHDRLGRVFRAVDARTMRPVVIRLLRVATLVAEDRVEATRVEMRRILRAASTVSHPNLAEVLEITSWKDLEIVTWDDFGGTRLSERLSGAPAVEALRWSVEIASAIARAHSRSVPHGRISMANLMVARDDGVRVLDLGVPRPREVPFLVDRPEEGGPLRPLPRDLPGLLRRDVAALVSVVRDILDHPSDVDDAGREDIRSRVDEALTGLSHPRATAGMLHTALVAVARDTPAVRGRPFAASSAAAPPAPPPPGTPEGELPPFSLAAYQPASVTDRGTAGAPLRSWGAAAFEPDPPDPAEMEAVAETDAEPPVMTQVLLVPGDDEAVSDPEDEDEPPTRRRGLIAAASLLGIAIAVGAFALQNLNGPSPRTASSAADGAAIPATPVPATRPAALTGGPPAPVAPPGRPAGTLVVAVSDSTVLVSVDGSRPEPAPTRWDRMPTGNRVVRIFRAGRLERVDTVNIRPALTTTRYYVLVPTPR